MHLLHLTFGVEVHVLPQPTLCVCGSVISGGSVAAVDLLQRSGLSSTCKV